MHIINRRPPWPRHYTKPLADLRAPAEPAPVETPVTSDFTPGQTLAMLTMRRSDLGNAVLAKLKASTARATVEDYQDLMTLGYALRQADGFHRLTPRGHFKANDLARALAEQLGIPIATSTPDRRSAFRPGLMSQNGNW